MPIDNFSEVRNDGRIITKTITLEKMAKLGWAPDLVVQLRWNWNGKRVVKNYPTGVLGKHLEPHDRVAVIVDESGLQVLDGEGGLVFTVSDRIEVNGNQVRGAYRWFEPLPKPSASRFGAVLEDPEGRLYQVEIDVGTGAISNGRKVR
ncbi:hypothetical protein [Humisphaera borealis]|uniref:Uncharacterized protein n=1 Tax=Humisphaera borealis TaxID=2807512 RepID=A0A7M2WWY9_9BACT|nr:hypothetical protein [Humisphaera borealis]QOV89919.1 hypothetical protein IPV69_00670 [Humisphaera borealis]